MLRAQLLTPVIVNVLGKTTEIKMRTLGGLTGTRVAGVLSLIPVPTALDRCLPQLDALSFRCQTVTLTAYVYVDNVYFAGRSATAVASMFEIFERELQNQWSLFLKPSSLEILPFYSSLIPGNPSANFQRFKIVQNA